MSSPTWTPAALRSELRPYEQRVWRVVEAQHHFSTRKIVDTATEQNLLEDLIEKAKPPVPIECRGLDWLLSTPFRYDAPYPIGSRFRRAGRTAGVFYAAETPETAVAEMAFHRLLFFADSPSTPWPVNPAEYTAFSAGVRTERSLDLTKPPLDASRALWRHPTEYDPCQAVADTAREIGAETLRYEFGSRSAGRLLRGHPEMRGVRKAETARKPDMENWGRRERSLCDPRIPPRPDRF